LLLVSNSNMYAQAPVEGSEAIASTAISSIAPTSYYTSLLNEHSKELIENSDENIAGEATNDDDDDDEHHHHHHSITCIRQSNLDFGGAFSGISPGTVILDPNPATARIATGGAVLNPHIPGHPAFLQLTISNDDHCSNHDHCSNDNDECDRSEDDDNRTNDTRGGFSRHGVWNTITLPSSSC
jgi:hypothetical protein